MVQCLGKMRWIRPKFIRLEITKAIEWEGFVKKLKFENNIIFREEQDNLVSAKNHIGRVLYCKYRLRVDVIH